MLKSSIEELDKTKSDLKPERQAKQQAASQTHCSPLPTSLSRLGLGSEWLAVTAKEYEPIKVLGNGSYGQVVEAKKTDGSLVAIKHMAVDTSKKYRMILLYRELAILEFLTMTSKAQKLPSLFTECLDVFAPAEEIDCGKL